MQGTQLANERNLNVTESDSRERLFNFEPNLFSKSYNHEAFLFEHNISGNPLFQFDRLFELCRRHPPENVKFRHGKISKLEDFDASFGRFNEDLTLESAINDFDNNGSYIAIYYPELDQEYRPIIERLLSEINEHIRGLDSPITWFATYIFMSTGQSVTPYHMDREMNFLLQIHGNKGACLWNGYDDMVIKPHERDLLLANFSAKRPQFRDELDKYGKQFELKPGTGLHHPFIAPHLISTKSQRSISLAVTYRTELSDIWTDAHCFNHHISKLGLAPSPVRVRHNSDYRKAKTIRFARKALKPFKKIRKLIT